MEEGLISLTNMALLIGQNNMGIEINISITYDPCLTCQLSANDKEGIKKHSCKSA